MNMNGNYKGLQSSDAYTRNRRPDVPLRQA
jgi:hypothetical protein